MKTQAADRVILITAPNFGRVMVTLVGVSPYVQLRFGEKAKAAMRTKQEAGSRSKKGQAKEARQFDDDYMQAMYALPDGARGIPASCFRNACISACRLVGFEMTRAKLSVFVEADGADALDGTPLVRISGEPQKVEHAVRNATGVADIRVRAMWRDWSAVLRMTYDADQFSDQDLINLLSRAGRQVGIGEGRPDSKRSAGMGWGLFRVESAPTE